MHFAPCHSIGRRRLLLLNLKRILKEAARHVLGTMFLPRLHSGKAEGEAERLLSASRLCAPRLSVVASARLTGF